MFTFSTILFFSGYVLQQKTVRDIQAIIRPPADPVPWSSDGQEELVPFESMNWDEMAYVQVIQHYEDACNSVILFAELARQKSLAKRILLYPPEWEREIALGRSRSRTQERSIKLLRRASARYSISMRATDVRFRNMDRESQLSPLAAISVFTEFKSVLYLQPRGFVANAIMLDRLFGLAVASSKYSVTHFVGPATGADEPLAFMMSPSPELHQKAKQDLSASMSAEQCAEALDSRPSAADAFLSSSSLRSTQVKNSYSDANPFFNFTGYVKFTDPEIIGPEFDIPRQAWLRARPAVDGPRQLWESLYEQYRGQRMGVCGLDLEPLPNDSGEEALATEGDI